MADTNGHYGSMDGGGGVVGADDHHHHYGYDSPILISDSSGGGQGSNNPSILLMEPRPFRPFKTSEDYLVAMKEDLAEWLNTLYALEITIDNFMECLETGVVLCKHANNVRKAALDFQKANGGMAMAKTATGTGTAAGAHPTYLSVTAREVSYRRSVAAGTFQARDNISNFISWCRSLGIYECLLFETEDLVMRKNEKSFILCLLEVARVGSKFGMPAPMLVQMEEEIDRDIAKDNAKGNGEEEVSDEETQPPLQIITNDLKSLDEMVRDLVNRCSCPTQFSMVRVSEGKYRIGDTQVLIYVRILRSHVMVRVGGGWDTLEHHLDKHDPCRCRQGHRPTMSSKVTVKHGGDKGTAQTQMKVTYERSVNPPVPSGFIVPHLNGRQQQSLSPTNGSPPRARKASFSSNSSYQQSSGGSQGSLITDRSITEDGSKRVPSSPLPSFTDASSDLSDEGYRTIPRSRSQHYNRVAGEGFTTENGYSGGWYVSSPDGRNSGTPSTNNKGHNGTPPQSERSPRKSKIPCLDGPTTQQQPQQPQHPLMRMNGTTRSVSNENLYRAVPVGRSSPQSSTRARRTSHGTLMGASPMIFANGNSGSGSSSGGGGGSSSPGTGAVTNGRNNINNNGNCRRGSLSRSISSDQCDIYATISRSGPGRFSHRERKHESPSPVKYQPDSSTKNGRRTWGSADGRPNGTPGDRKTRPSLGPDTYRPFAPNSASTPKQRGGVGVGGVGGGQRTASRSSHTSPTKTVNAIEKLVKEAKLEQNFNPEMMREVIMRYKADLDAITSKHNSGSFERDGQTRRTTGSSGTRAGGTRKDTSPRPPAARDLYTDRWVLENVAQQQRKRRSSATDSPTPSAGSPDSGSDFGSNPDSKDSKASSTSSRISPRKDLLPEAGSSKIPVPTFY